MAPTTKKPKIQKTLVVQAAVEDKSRVSPPWDSKEMDDDLGSLTPDSNTADISTPDSSQLAKSSKRSEPCDGFESQQQGRKKTHSADEQLSGRALTKQSKALNGLDTKSYIPPKPNPETTAPPGVTSDLNKTTKVGDIFILRYLQKTEFTSTSKTLSHEAKDPDPNVASSKVNLEAQTNNNKKFNDIFKNVLLDKDVRYLEDLDNHPNIAPEVDGVMDEDLQDDLLKDQYHDLPPLPGGCSIVSWSDEPSEMEGWTLFKYWGRQNPNLNINNAMQSIQFAKSGRYINPSRVEPKYVTVRPMYQSSENKRMFVGKDVAVCVSPVYSSESLLLEGKTAGLPQKLISGIFHSQEWQRFEAFMCLSFSHEVLIAQYKDHALEFSTRPKKKYDASSSRFEATDGMFGSPSRRTSNVVQRFKPVLDFSDEVKIYDGRIKSFNIDNDLQHLATILPIFEGEVPKGSFLIVGYTVNDYGSQKGRCLACCIQWGIVCGTKN